MLKYCFVASTNIPTRAIVCFDIGEPKGTEDKSKINYMLLVLSLSFVIIRCVMFTWPHTSRFLVNNRANENNWKHLHKIQSAWITKIRKEGRRKKETKILLYYECKMKKRKKSSMPQSTDTHSFSTLEFELNKFSVRFGKEAAIWWKNKIKPSDTFV